MNERVLYLGYHDNNIAHTILTNVNSQAFDIHICKDWVDARKFLRHQDIKCILLASQFDNLSWQTITSRIHELKTSPDISIDWYPPAIILISDNDLDDAGIQEVFQYDIIDHLPIQELTSLKLQRRIQWAIHNQNRLFHPTDALSIKMAREEIEHTLQHALEQEKQVSALRSQFIALASHEFRSPLTVILTTNETMERFWERLKVQDRDRYFKRIYGQIDRMVNILDDILLVGRLQDDVDMTRYFDTDLMYALIVDVTISRLIMYPNRMITVGINTPTTEMMDDSDFRIWIDTTLMKRLVEHLLDNAIKYSPPESEISLKVSANTHNVTLEIEDEGIGITQQDLTQITTALYRGDNVGDVYGNGLGLYIVQKIVDVHQGSLMIDSILNQGTRVTIQFPKQAH